MGVPARRHAVTGPFEAATLAAEGQQEHVVQRTIVQVTRMRIVDLEIGDIVNSDPTATTGWFPVEEIRRLPNGDINVTNAATRDSVMARDWDIVGVQVTKRVDDGAAQPG